MTAGRNRAAREIRFRVSWRDFTETHRTAGGGSRIGENGRRSSCSGTDGQFHADTGMTEDQIRAYFNQYLPEDIAVLSVEKVPDKFHSRLNAVQKRIYTGLRWGRRRMCSSESTVMGSESGCR